METEDDQLLQTGAEDGSHVDLLNHCAVCLTHFDSVKCKGGRVVLEGVSLKHLWGHFLEINGGNGRCNKNVQTWTFVNPTKDEVTTVPPLCLECSEIILELNKRYQAYMETWRFFQAQIKLLHGLLAEKENVQRYKKFQESLERAERLDVSWKQKTRMFLESIRRQVGDPDDPDIFSESTGGHLDSCDDDEEEMLVEVKDESLDDPLIEDGKCEAIGEYTGNSCASAATNDDESTFMNDETGSRMDAGCYDERLYDNNDEDSDYDHYEPSPENVESSSGSGDEEELISIETPRQESISINIARQESMNINTSHPKVISVSTSRRKNPLVKRNIIEDGDEDPLAEISAPSSSYTPYEPPRKARKFDANRCHLCSFIVTPPNKKRHYATRHRNHPYNCDICGYNILPEDFPSHLEAHVGDYITKCTNSSCSYVAINHKRLWKLHLSRRNEACKDAGRTYAEYWAKFPKTCEYCKVTVKGSSYVSILNHVFDCHEGKSVVKPFSCPIETCDKKFAYRESVQLHLSDHALNTLIFEDQPCSVCYKLYMPPDILAGHLRGFHKFSEIIKCEHCPYVFGTRKFLLDHMCEFHVKLLGGIPCDICKDKDPTRYTTIGHLRAHYSEVHQIGAPLICDQCGFSTFMELNLHFHKINHDKYKLRMPKELIKCKMCEEKFLTKLKQWTHMREIHNDNRPLPSPKKKIHHYKCEFCNQIFNEKPLLRAHCKSDHPKTHVCESCGKNFKNSSSLAAHRKLHEGERPFVCEVCAHAFAQQGDLNSHMRIHTGERPYKCSMCSESFRQRTGLRKHSLAVHQVDKTYVCSRDASCGKSFTTYKELSHHEIREHENVCHWCTEERKEFKTRIELNHHLRHHHRNTFTIKCDQCETLCASEAGLVTHRVLKHKH